MPSLLRLGPTLSQYPQKHFCAFLTYFAAHFSSTDPICLSLWVSDSLPPSRFWIMLAVVGSSLLYSKSTPACPLTSPRPHPVPATPTTPSSKPPSYQHSNESEIGLLLQSLSQSAGPTRVLSYPTSSPHQNSSCLNLPFPRPHQECLPHSFMHCISLINTFVICLRLVCPVTAVSWNQWVPSYTVNF